MKKSTKIMLPLAGAALITEEMYRYIFCTPSKSLFTLFAEKKGHENQYYEYKKEARAHLLCQEHREYSIISERGEKLKGFYYPNGSEGKKIAFIIHGYRSENSDTAGPFYEYYKSRGIDIFACDHTAHGQSEGHFVGYDYFESKDCLKWIDFLKENFGDDIEIILHGFSMGGATVLQMSSHCPENVKFIIDDSGYSSAMKSLKSNIGPMSQPMRFIHKLLAGYDLKDADVAESLSKSELPILFVHGYDDKLVPFKTSQMLYDSYQGPKDCLFVPDTRHIEAIYTFPEEYAEKTDSFIEKYM